MASSSYAASGSHEHCLSTTSLQTIQDRPPFVVLEVHRAHFSESSICSSPKRDRPGQAESNACDNCNDHEVEDGGQESVELVPLTWDVVHRVPYVAAALAKEWRRSPLVHADKPNSALDFAISTNAPLAVVQVFLPPSCSCAVLKALIARLGVDSHAICTPSGGSSGTASPATDFNGAMAAANPLPLRWRPTDLHTALRLLQVASMLQIEHLLPELIDLVRGAIVTDEDYSMLESAIASLELPPALRVAADALRPPAEPPCLPNETQVRGMIASALLTADGKVWRVVQKVIDRREAWPRTAKENADVLLAFATGQHGSIRATPHTGFFWGSRDFLYLVCRYIRARPEHFDAMVSAMFDSVYSMDPELPAEIIDAVFKELLSFEGLTFAQCEHVIAKLMQRSDQLGYLFHEWSGVFPTLPAAARRALAKGLLPAVGHCPHAALDFVLKELDLAPLPSGRHVRGRAFASMVWIARCFGIDNVIQKACCARRNQSATASLSASEIVAHAPISGLAASASTESGAHGGEMGGASAARRILSSTSSSTHYDGGT
eukprot:TRINITY_DN57993_c0_g1_i1.p1 TRINITY_DN57993_c0_g1~~TRINITY_DN57993_c0_g1_i1.p1  ORF type:complete len:549 (+),score=48.07 TRINITY_DN57993_c0_g1_i1:64-1710(+)